MSELKKSIDAKIERLDTAGITALLESLVEVDEKFNWKCLPVETSYLLNKVKIMSDLAGVLDVLDFLIQKCILLLTETEASKQWKTIRSEEFKHLTLDQKHIFRYLGQLGYTKQKDGNLKLKTTVPNKPQVATMMASLLVIMMTVNAYIEQGPKRSHKTFTTLLRKDMKYEKKDTVRPKPISGYLSQLQPAIERKPVLQSAVKQPDCAMCEEEIARVICAKCDKKLCNACDVEWHENRRRKDHVRCAIESKIEQDEDDDWEQVPRPSSEPKCEQCKKSMATEHCHDCDVIRCIACDTQWHNHELRKDHVRVQTAAYYPAITPPTDEQSDTAAVEQTQPTQPCSPSGTVASSPAKQPLSNECNNCGIINSAEYECQDCEERLCSSCNKTWHGHPSRHNHKQKKLEQVLQVFQECDTCGVKKAFYKCPQCNDKALCSECDLVWHNHPKRLAHQPIALPGHLLPSTAQQPDGTCPPVVVFQECDTCGVKKAFYKCPQCNDKALCSECDLVWHNHPKRLAHQPIALPGHLLPSTAQQPDGTCPPVVDCDTCGVKKAFYKCPQCNDKALCSECDLVWHSHPKRLAHQPIALPGHLLPSTAQQPDGTCPPAVGLTAKERKQLTDSICSYMNDAHLSRDVHLSRKMLDGFLPISILAALPNVRTVTEDEALISRILQGDSRFAFSADGAKVQLMKLPAIPDQKPHSIDCTELSTQEEQPVNQPPTSNENHFDCDACFNVSAAYGCFACDPVKRLCINCNTTWHKHPDRTGHEPIPISDTVEEATNLETDSVPTALDCDLCTEEGAAAWVCGECDSKPLCEGCNERWHSHKIRRAHDPITIVEHLQKLRDEHQQRQAEAKQQDASSQAAGGARSKVLNVKVTNLCDICSDAAADMLCKECDDANYMCKGCENRWHRHAARKHHEASRLSDLPNDGRECTACQIRGIESSFCEECDHKIFCWVCAKKHRNEKKKHTVKPIPKYDFEKSKLVIELRKEIDHNTDRNKEYMAFKLNEIINRIVGQVYSKVCGGEADEITKAVLEWFEHQLLTEQQCLITFMKGGLHCNKFPSETEVPSVMRLLEKKPTEPSVHSAQMGFEQLHAILKKYLEKRHIDTGPVLMIFRHLINEEEENVELFAKAHKIAIHAPSEENPLKPDIAEQEREVDELRAREEKHRFQEAGMRVIQEIQEAERKNFSDVEIDIALQRSPHNLGKWLLSEWLGMCKEVLTKINLIASVNEIGTFRIIDARKALAKKFDDVEDAAMLLIQQRKKILKELTTFCTSNTLEELKSAAQQYCGVKEAFSFITERNMQGLLNTWQQDLLHLEHESDINCQVLKDIGMDVKMRSRLAMLGCGYKALSNGKVLIEALTREWEPGHFEVSIQRMISSADKHDDMTQFLADVQPSCPICLDTLPSNEEMHVLPCDCMFCKKCFMGHFEVVIANNPITEFGCPQCKKPKIKPVTGDVQKYFQFLQQNLKPPILRENLYSILENKIMFAAFEDSKMIYCIKCRVGFMFEDEGVPRVRCPYCKFEQCYQCEEQWCTAHADRSCTEYQQFKKEEAEGGERSKQEIEQIMQNETLECPNCKNRFQLSRGACMHFTCRDCGHEFCSDCFMQFSKKCEKFANCHAMGFHCHHPRNCHASLRNEEPETLEQLLQNHNAELATRDDATDGCVVVVTDDNHEEGPCGKDVHKLTLCRAHYVEYLVQRVNEERIDPIEIMDTKQLTQILQRNEKNVPQLTRNADADRQALIQAIKAQLPLQPIKTVNILK